MKKILYRFILPAIVLAVVYHFGYSSGKSAGIRSSAVLPPVTSSPQALAPASITSPTLPTSPPDVVETTEIQPPTVPRIRKASDGLVVENRPVQALPSKSAVQASGSSAVNASDKAVFRTPNVSGVSLVPSEPTPQAVPQRTLFSELSPLKSSSAPATLPLLVKPSANAQDDCDCDK
jgi:hypothetical protein